MIGITERGDGGLDFSWISKLQYVDGAVIISKNCNDDLIDNLILNKEKIIFHSTITGLGGTLYEPNVPKIEYSFKQIQKLIDKGFPKNQIVIRIDPIFPELDFYSIISPILEFCINNELNRIRFSFFDLYPHVMDRFKFKNIPLPQKKFYADTNSINNVILCFNQYKNLFFEACGEYINDNENVIKRGCISKHDYDILNIPFKLERNTFQRKTCSCVNKVELLSNKKRCSHKCIYCYWKD